MLKTWSSETAFLFLSEEKENLGKEKERMTEGKKTWEKKRKRTPFHRSRYRRQRRVFYFIPALDLRGDQNTPKKDRLRRREKGEKCGGLREFRGQKIQIRRPPIQISPQAEVRPPLKNHSAPLAPPLPLVRQSVCSSLAFFRPLPPSGAAHRFLEPNPAPPVGSDGCAGAVALAHGFEFLPP